ncbi:hypothetical protein WJU23_02235 [Prosthecobacter sp. SYSU 5D2]|uniref:GAP1-N2 domain-containing protein n=1 Tax=Prosthecobacter sp. SYSU 5D2 TaxID=3134134 RepID=UPI0031FE5F62
MAWQLIYTSAPRLLDAGRTGFGTVARHRAISGILSSAIERFSQFSRQPGHDPKRVIYSHRIVTAGAGTYHVLSCIRDCGSDYTGRTSHIAHHLIAELKEIRTLVAQGITPADVLLGMDWRSSWNSSPRYLDPGDEISLIEMSRRPGTEWLQETGDQANARLPYSANARRGCYVILPARANALKLFHESQCEDRQGAWEVTFTTCLEPGDEIGDFRWLGVAATSPQRPQEESSTRPIFDLTQPGKLPPPPAAARARPMITETALADSPENDDAFADDLPVQGPAATSPMSTAGAWAPEPLARPKPKGRLLLAGVMVTSAILLAVAGAFFWQMQETKKAATSQQRMEQRVDDLWEKYSLKHEEVARWLKSQEDPQLIDEHETALKEIRKSMLAPGSAKEIPMPARMDPADQFKELLEDHDDWAESYQAAQLSADWTVKPPVEMMAQAKPKVDAEKRAWKKLTEHFDRPVEQAVSAEEALAARVLTVLRGGPKPKGKASEWKALLTSLDASTQAPAWLSHWESAEKASAAEKSLLPEVPEKVLADAPSWFTKQIISQRPSPAVAATPSPSVPEPDTRPDLPPGAMPSSPAQLTMPDPVAALPMPASGPQSALNVPATQASGDEDVRGTYPIFLLVLDPRASPAPDLGLIPRLPVDDGMKVFLSSQAGGRNLEEWPLNATQSQSGGSLVYSKSKMAGRDRQIAFSDNRITHLPELQQDVRLVARTANGQKVLFEVRVVVSDPEVLLNFGSAPAFQASASGNQVLISGLDAFLRRIQIAGIPRPQFALSRDSSMPGLAVYELQEDSSGEYRVRLRQETVAPGASRIKDLNSRIAILEQGIQMEGRLRDLLASNLTGREGRVNIHNEAIAAKKAELEKLNLQLEELTKAPPPKLELPPGTYMLKEISSGQKNLCRVEIQPPSQ